MIEVGSSMRSTYYKAYNRETGYGKILGLTLNNSELIQSEGQEAVLTLFAINDIYIYPDINFNFVNAKTAQPL